MRFRLQRNRSGAVLFNTMILVLLLIFTGFAFTRWAADEAFQNEFEIARKQAYYVAEYGAYAEALKYIRTRPPSMIDPTTVFAEGQMYDAYGNLLDNTRYSNVTIKHMGGTGNNENAFFTSFHYDIYSTGTVAFNNGNEISRRGGSRFPGEISRTIKLRTKLRTYADYMYLTNEEQTVFNEIIWFWQHDILYGRVHSNSQIGIKNNPTFYGPVSTTASEFYESSANPYFAYPPLFNANPVEFPTTAEQLRSGAAASGYFISDSEGQYWTRLWCDNGAWQYIQWPAGTPYDSLTSPISGTGSINVGGETGAFFEGELYMWGEGASGRLTIGSSGNMWLVDDVTIGGHAVNSRLQIESSNPNILGLIAEQNIMIMDSYPNGRGNSGGGGGFTDNTNITITAALVALGESFTFQHQNDTWNTYRWCPGHSTADERGDIILRGAVTQRRRGYVHRSNCGGTGYGKDYLYDFRLGRKPPPYYMEATDDQGNALFDVVRIEEVPPEKNPRNL